MNTYKRFRYKKLRKITNLCIYPILLCVNSDFKQFCYTNIYRLIKLLISYEHLNSCFLNPLGIMYIAVGDIGIKNFFIRYILLLAGIPNFRLNFQVLVRLIMYTSQ